jgi:O-antigen ligase
MNRESIDTVLKWLLLGLVLAALAFGALAFGAVRMSELVVLRWLLLVAIGVWLLRLWISPSYRFLMPPTAWLVLPFVAYAAWRYRVADVEYLARHEFLQAAFAALIFLTLVNNLYGQLDLRVLTTGLVALGTLVAMYGIYQWMTGHGQVWHFERPGYEGRGSGTYVCPNHLAGFLELLLPLAVTFTLLRGFGPVARIFFCYSALVMLVGIAATGSRAGWISTAVSMMVLALVLARRGRQLWSALVLVVLVAGLGAWLYSKALQNRVNPQLVTREQIRDDVRVRLWTAAARMWRDHPWFGVGPNHFDARYPGYRQPHWKEQMRPVRAHNDYVNTLADWGLTGLVLVLVPLVAAGLGIIRGWKHLQRSGESGGNRVALVLGCTAGLTALAVHSFFDFNLHIPANAFLASTWLAVIATHSRFSTQRWWFTARWPLKLATTTVLAGTLFYLVPLNTRLTREVVALQKGEAARTLSPERMIALRAAWATEPKNAETAFAIGEELRLRASLGQDGHEKATEESLPWFEHAAQLNIWDPLPPQRAGMALDWLGRHEEAERHFEQALQLDPNSADVRSMMGWHYFQMDDYANSKRWMERSLEINGGNINFFALNYLALIEKAQAEQKRWNLPPAAR